MNPHRQAVRNALIKNSRRTPPHAADRRFQLVPRDEALFVQFVLECGSFHTALPAKGGWGCMLQVYTESHLMLDTVWRGLANSTASGAHWMTIEASSRLPTPDADNNPQYVTGIRLGTKESTQAYARFLRGMDPQWRKHVWSAWADATDLYGRGPTRAAREAAALKLKLAVRAEPPTPVIRWLEQRRILPKGAS